MKNVLSSAGYCYDSSSRVWTKQSYASIVHDEDNEIDKRIAEIIAKTVDVSVLSPELRQQCTDWPAHYHLDANRANILRPFEKSLSCAAVLEIGAGCGVITRYLGECGAKVIALEGAPHRAVIARSRTRDLHNVEVLVDRFDRFICNHKFDVITLIGALEYANLFTDAESPPLAILQRVRDLLKPGGKVIIAIENQFGLKYFAGAAEDHLGQSMYGIEGRYRQNQPQTWGRYVLENLLKRSGFESCEFMAPFPDYKLPISIVTEAGFNATDFDASAFAWQSARNDLQLPSPLNFSPELAWPGIFDNKLGLDLANSFLIVGSLQEPVEGAVEKVLAYHYSTRRIVAYCKETRFVRCLSDQIGVFVRKIDSEAELPGMAPVIFVPHEESDYVHGSPLSREFIRIVTRDEWSMDEVAAYFRRYFAIVDAYVESVTGESSSNKEILPAFCFDLIPSNILCKPTGGCQVIDQEWKYIESIPRPFLLFRGVNVLLCSITKFGRPATGKAMTRAEFVAKLFQLLCFDSDVRDLGRWFEKEAEIQKIVAGRAVAEKMTEWDVLLETRSKDTQISVLLHEFTIAQGAIVELLDKNSVLENKNNILRDHINELWRSRSWWITKPLRFIAHAARRKLHLGVKTR